MAFSWVLCWAQRCRLVYHTSVLGLLLERGTTPTRIPEGLRDNTFCSAVIHKSSCIHVKTCCIDFQFHLDVNQGSLQLSMIPYRVYKKGFEVLGLWSHVGRPWNFAFRYHAYGVYVIKMRTGCKQKQSSPGK